MSTCTCTADTDACETDCRYSPPFLVSLLAAALAADFASLCTTRPFDFFFVFTSIAFWAFFFRSSSYLIPIVQTGVDVSIDTSTQKPVATAKLTRHKARQCIALHCIALHVHHWPARQTDRPTDKTNNRNRNKGKTHFDSSSTRLTTRCFGPLFRFSEGTLTFFLPAGFLGVAGFLVNFGAYPARAADALVGDDHDGDDGRLPVVDFVFFLDGLDGESDTGAETAPGRGNAPSLSLLDGIVLVVLLFSNDGVFACGLRIVMFGDDFDLPLAVALLLELEFVVAAVAVEATLALRLAFDLDFFPEFRITTMFASFTASFCGTAPGAEPLGRTSSTMYRDRTGSKDRITPT